MAKRKAAAAARQRPPRREEKAVPPGRAAPRQRTRRSAARRAPAAKKREAGEEEKGRARSAKPVPRRRRSSRPAARPAGAGERPRRSAAAAPAGQSATPREQPPRSRSAPGKTARLDRVRRTLDETGPRSTETVQTPPSSLDMDRHGSAARTGRAEIAEARADHLGMRSAISPPATSMPTSRTPTSPATKRRAATIPTPDQDIVDDIGKALGVEYQDNEELRASDKVVERDKHRWELDPASSEDYKDRK